MLPNCAATVRFSSRMELLRRRSGPAGRDGVLLHCLDAVKEVDGGVAVAAQSGGEPPQGVEEVVDGAAVGHLGAHQAVAPVVGEDELASSGRDDCLSWQRY